WVHNGFVTVESEKMSKSLGNFITIRDALNDYPAEVLRLFLLSKHYRSPLDFTRRDVLDLQSGLVRIYRTLQRLDQMVGVYEWEEDDRILLSGEQNDGLLGQFVDLMDDDLNTAGAIGLVFEKVREMNRLMDTHDAGPDVSILERLKDERHDLFTVARVLGILDSEHDEFFSEIAQAGNDIDRDEIERMIQERRDARAGKDWARADDIRDRLQEMGVVLEDGPKGTTWRFDV
ncbi:MAG: class I tRNA ligase family protein, partial [Deltaproteobacteria bacterium]|nr:class I tRNA ligase family protein [Deltaproteobacteria bacterium]